MALLIRSNVSKYILSEMNLPRKSGKLKGFEEIIFVIFERKEIALYITILNSLLPI